MRKKHLQEEESIRLQQAELMAKFAELSPDIIFRFDISGKISLANNSAHKVFPDSNLLGDDACELLPEISGHNIEDVITRNKRVEFVSNINERAYQFIVAGVSKAQSGQIYGRDITILQEHQKKLSAALKKAEIAKELKTDFLARISHEIRMPLAAIQGFTQLILADLSEQLSDDYLGMFRAIENNSKRLYRTIDLILNMSQIQTGDYEPVFTEVNLTQVLEKQYKEFRSLAVEKKLEFNIEYKIAESVTVEADYYSIEQILINLIGNAFKFTQTGSINILVEPRDDAICVDITDTGIGISKEYLKKIFTPFSQEKMGYTRPFEGAGLGLALVKSFSDMNNAIVKVKSIIHEGSTFTICFGGKK